MIHYAIVQHDPIPPSLKPRIYTFVRDHFPLSQFVTVIVRILRAIVGL